MRSLLIIQHVPHERLGMLEDGFIKAGCRLQPLNIFEPKAAWPRLSGDDGRGKPALEEIGGVVSMGGPMSVYQQAKYPWIGKELALLREAAVERKLPVLGVCLGAQMLAAALGARVAPSPQKEIGWYPVMREPGADGDPLCEPFGQTETVFQWHGDTFALPKGAVQLFSSPLCTQQAFRYGDRAWGLQFHIEVTEAMIRAWMRTPVNRAELAALKGVIPPPAAARRACAHGADPPSADAAGGGMIDPTAIRRQNPAHAGRLRELSHHVATAFATIVQRHPTHSRSVTHARSR